MKKITIAVIAFLIVLIVASTFLYAYQVRNQQLYGKLINLSGRQRMLSQKITKNCFKLYNNEGESELSGIISNDLGEFQENLVFLKSQTPEGSEIVTLLNDIEPNLNTIVKIAQGILVGNETKVLTELNRAERSFLIQMDNIVSKYELLLEEKQNELEYSIYIFSAFITLALFLITLFILLPAIKNNEEKGRILLNKNEELESFVYIASHDLQEPLSTIMGFASMIETEYKDKLDDNGKKMLQHIHNSTVRMRNLIKSLLDYSRLQIEKTKEEINMEDLLYEIMTELAPLIENKNAIINYNSLHNVDGNKIEMRVLFQNLILNAIKYKNEHLDPIIVISSRELNNHIEYTVKDNGIGIDPKYFNRIFKMFQKLEQPEKSESMGIGLTHCKKIIENHNGEIRVESEPSKGSSFIFTISK